MSTQTAVIDGYVAGTWTIDAVHSDVSFYVRHLGVSKVRGQFATFEGTIVTAEDPLESTVTTVIKTASVNTNNETRDAHVRSADFLDSDTYPEITFRSTSIKAESAAVFQIEGDLTLRGVTKPVTLELELNGFGTHYEGHAIAGFSAATEISRTAFGVTGGAAGAAVGDKIRISLEIEATQAKA